MEETILIAISKWAVKNLNIVGALKNVGTEVLEKIVWTPLKDKIINFFESDKETEEFVKEISTKVSNNNSKPYRDVEDVYENMKGELPDKQLFNTIVQFFADNQDLLQKGNLLIDEEKQGKIIVNQNADKIFNAQVMNINKVE